MSAKVNLLNVIPCCSEHIIVEQEGELVVIAFPRFKRAWVQKYLLPKGVSPYIRVRLEEHGTAVWNLIDGKRNVREIIELLSEHFDGEDNYASRTILYLSQLRKDGFIKFLIQ